MNNFILPKSAVEILEFATRHLQEQQIEYFVTGSTAMSLYGIARTTRDIDIVANLKLSDAEKIISVFSEEYFLNPKTVYDEIQRQGMFNLISQHSNYKLDFVMKQSTEFHEAEFSRKKKYGYFILKHG